LVDIQKAAINAQIPEASTSLLDMLPVQRDQGENIAVGLDKELEDAGKEVVSSMNERQRQMLDALDLKKLGHCFLLSPSSSYFIPFSIDMRLMMLVQTGV
jgi:hypothetical protein